MTVLLAVDPGNVSGVAVLRLDDLDDAPLTYELDKQQTYSFIHSLRYGTMQDRSERMEMVAERFVISQRTIRSERQDDALNILGYLDSLHHLYGIPLHLQSPAQAKKFVSDDRLRRLGWYRRTKDGHANDAQRHLLTYLASHHRSDPKVAALLMKAVA